MLAILHLLAIFVADLFKPRRQLEVENLFLRHQFVGDGPRGRFGAFDVSSTDKIGPVDMNPSFAKSLSHFCAWLEQTPLSQAIQTTNWIVPTVQSVHILAIAVIATSALMIAECRGAWFSY
jgi:hypothetical protein